MSLQHRQQVTFLGMMIGAMLGAIGALVWLDYLSDMDETDNITKLSFGDAARIGTATFALARQIYALANEEQEAE